jgi:DNA-binding transcriptional regulator PaaX
MRLRDVAVEVGVTERAVQRIVADLEEGGSLPRRRSGRHNEYEIKADQPLRHALEAHQNVQSLIHLVSTSTVEDSPRKASKPRRRSRT